MAKIAPSVIAADFGRLAEQMAECERAGADLIHFDAMDGHFVPNISIGPMVLKAVRKATTLRIDVHLMLSEPERYLESFADAGADTLIVHVEAGPHLHRTLGEIRRLGKRAGVALNPATPAAALDEVTDMIDQLLVMTVNPGFGGQAFIPSMLAKIIQLRASLDRRSTELAVDGGIDEKTAKAAADCGAKLFVAGTSVFSHPGGIGAGIAAVRGATG